MVILGAMAALCSERRILFQRFDSNSLGDSALLPCPGGNGSLLSPEGELERRHNNNTCASSSNPSH